MQIEPYIRPVGDRFILVEFGNDLSLFLNFRCIQFGQALIKASVRGLTELVTSYTTVLIGYDPLKLSKYKLGEVCQEILKSLSPIDEIELPSRLIEVPVAYDDRWTRHCVEDYCRQIKKIEHNPSFVARVNGLKSIEELIRFHSTPEWWVGHIGFLAGLPTLMSLDPRYQLKAPKYNPPRLWTPKGTIALGGALTAIFPMVSPDGYQILGRTPIPIYDPERRFEAFNGSFFLFRVGDRARFVPITEQHFEEIEQSVEVGKYVFRIGKKELFSVRTYKKSQGAI